MKIKSRTFVDPADIVRFSTVLLYNNVLFHYFRVSILYLQVLVRRSLIYGTLYQEVVADCTLVGVYFATFDHHAVRSYTAKAGRLLFFRCCGFI